MRRLWVPADEGSTLQPWVLAVLQWQGHVEMLLPATLAGAGNILQPWKVTGVWWCSHVGVMLRSVLVEY